VSDRCPQCEEHAELHKGNWLGLGPQNEPCPPCEDHARNGCPDKRKKQSVWW
jgi:hypothetical protein